MRKGKAALAFLAILMVLMLFGCQEKPEEQILPEPISQWTVTEGITLRLLNDQHPEGVERMTMILENRTDQVMSYGNGWRFERFEGGQWKPLKNREDAAFTAEGHTLYDLEGGQGVESSRRN